VNRGKDNRLDATDGALLAPQVLKEIEHHRKGGTMPSATAVASVNSTDMHDSPSRRPIAVSLANASFNCISNAFFIEAIASAGPEHFSNPHSRRFEAPFDHNAPFPVMASLTSDEPSYNKARNSRNWLDWEDACINEIDGLWRSECITEEVPEDSLSTWDKVERVAHEDINAIWVLKIKRGPDGEIDKYKGQCCANDSKSIRE
jgi:hypothetical protein